jgi:mono/diheme cytochrome c family protein
MNRWPFRQGAALGIGIMVLLAVGAVALVNATAPTALPLGFAGDGVFVYEDHCSGCHGTYAEGTGVAPALVGQGTATDTRTTSALADVVRGGHGEMPGRSLADQDLADALAYLRELQAYG